MEIGYRQRGPQGNPGLDRFMASGRESREGGQQNLRTIGEMYKFYNQKEGGLFGRYGTQETKPQFANLTEAIGARGTDPNAASLVKSAYEGIDPGDWTKAKSQYQEQNPTIPGVSGEGLLGGIQQIGTGLDKMTGGYAGKAAGAIGDFAMDKLGGQKIKDWGTKALTGIADSAFGQGASSLFAGAGAIAPYAVLAKEVYDFMGNTKDAYEGYEQGIKNAGVMQQDLGLQRNEAKNRMLSQNVEVKEMVADRRGNLQDQVSGQAEQVISAGETAKIKSNLEMSDVAQGKIDKTSEGVKKNYMDTSRQLTKQQENLQLTNVDAYRRANQGIMQQESALQYDIDTMDQSRKDMKAMYQVSDFFV